MTDDSAQARTVAEPPRTRTADLVSTVLLLSAHIGLAFLIALIAPFFAMVTDSCAYQTCGDEAWVTRAIYVAFGAGALLVLVDAVVSFVLLMKNRLAFWVPLLGCFAQVGVGLVVLYMAALSGPQT